MNFFRTAAATSLVVVFLSACASTDSAAPGNSVPAPPSAAPSASSAAPPAVPPADVTTPPAVAPTTVGTGAPPGVRKPPAIPKTPTDTNPYAGWTEGYITRGGTGPCYGLADLDGKPYAIYSDAGTPLMKGAHIRAKLVPATLRINCGEGTQVQMEAVEQLP
ncbi:hypothetical protein [Actinoplanes sp. NPDC051859]|uniref:hypothetical protein n=1 Tax=Actinoplanes sp. NPDC051859 TaxID=3363909 RepID=UPI00379831D0